ncbi:MAG TPA: radical SAM family heme chaperone HemW [Afifellaceae bacterium]|nr:radical SAM family heme chaperone HemW [Afifellaceae bacterium]
MRVTDPVLEIARVPDEATAFGVYVHWPFCAAKCPYCDFNSHVRHKPVDEARFAAALARELAAFAERSGGRTVTSIFLGGGTPSLMRPETVEAVLSAVAELWPLAADAEITLEANPSSVEAGRFRGYRAAGVNRVSLGVQSLDDAALRFLGRLHDVAEARRAVELARSIFPRLSFDLIYARPNQTLAAWDAELRQALAMAADHLSLYQLTIEAGTPFAALHASGRLVTPDPDMLAEFYELTQDVCTTAGLPAYEISNHAAPGAESRHNLAYWRYQDYVGAGPGAHGRLTVGGVKRATRTEAHPESWLAQVEARGDGLVEDVALCDEETADELLLMGLRLREGIAPARWQRASGRPFDPARLRALERHGMVERLADGRLRATAAGWVVLDAVVADLAA